MRGLFSLKTPEDLRQKLHRDLDKLKAEPLNVDLAFNFFVTAEHMLDWVYPKRAMKAKREEVQKASTLLQVCSHLANSGKHFEVEAKHHTSVSSTGTSGSHFHQSHFPPTHFHPRHFLTGRLVVKLDGEAGKELGESVGVVDLAEKVLDYWDKHPLS